jgi:hypothetical protein
VVVVVSPPGGVGEVAACRAAEMGSRVRWFVVGTGREDAAQQTRVRLSREALDGIEAAGGALELAGADAAALLAAGDGSALLEACRRWCAVGDSLVCTTDGVEVARPPQKATKKKNYSDDAPDPVQEWKSAVAVAVREASRVITGTKVAVLSATEAANRESGEGGSEKRGGGKGLLGNLFGGDDRRDAPADLVRAVAGAGAGSVVKVRHGRLFGLPESSPDFSPLVGGPRVKPVLCEEYANRRVRVDPTLSVAGDYLMVDGATARTSRHAVGEAAALLALSEIGVSADNLDVCIQSQAGADPVSVEEWRSEFARVANMMQTGKAAQLFQTEFASVPDKQRLTAWLTTKWAPAVLRTYDIAAIRTGARPVYAVQKGDDEVEIVWQVLRDFNAVTAGRMVLTVTDTGLTAVRGPGDAAAGYGAVSTKPLPGEDVLVRLLAEAASQAVEKGLAVKVCR